MTTYSTDIHGPAADARATTGYVAKCTVCGVQWQIRSPNNDDAKGCNFCGAGEDAINLANESNTDYEATIYDGHTAIQ
jgi:hypothetical protein